MSIRSKVLTTLAVVSLLPGSASALETDQYLVWQEELADSADALNAFLNRDVEEALRRANRQGVRACEQLPPRIYRRLFRSMLGSRLRRFAHRHPAVERFPGEEVSYGRYLKMSVFRRPAFPFWLPLGRTIRVGEVYMGIDKLGHLFGFGRRYYERYRRELRNGIDEREAIRRVVRRGVVIERYFVGGLLDGVFSHADLEANFQGLQLARDLCEGEAPYLERTAGGWALVRPIDLRRYVTPDFDESYNNNHYTGWRWRTVRPILVEEYCPRYSSPVVQRRMRRYRELDSPSLSERVIADLYEERGRNPQLEQSLETICPPPGTALSARR